MDCRPLRHVDPVDVAVLSGLARNPRGRRADAHHLFDGIGSQLGTLAEHRPLLGMTHEQVHRQTELITRRVDAALEQQDDGGAQLGIAEAITVLVGVHQRLEEVVLRSSASLGNQAVGVDAHLLETPFDLVEALLGGNR